MVNRNIFHNFDIDEKEIENQVELALGIGEGADAQAPLARAVIGGLAGSTLITLALIPVIYTYFHSDRNEPC